MKQHKLQIESGDVFSRLTIINELDMFVFPSGRKTRYFLCYCICGNYTKVRLDHLRSLATQSCGCMRNEINKSHGVSNHEIYSVWDGMKARCYNPKSKTYKNYGARGIRICNEWLNVHNFIRDMYPSYVPGLSIERKNNDGNYELSNCRWATTKEQANNRRTNKIIICGNTSYTHTQLSLKLGKNRNWVGKRIRNGYCDYLIKRNKND